MQALGTIFFLAITFAPIFVMVLLLYLSLTNNSHTNARERLHRK